MITEYDDRVYVESEYVDDFKNAVEFAMNFIRRNFMKYARKGDLGYSHKFSPYVIRDAFDKLMMEYGFEVDGRSVRHAYGIGNNNEWDVVDKDMGKVGEFYANNNMYNGVYVGVSIKGNVVDSFEICSGGFIRE